MRSAVNVGRAGAKSAVNTTEVSIKCRDCQSGDGRRFGTFLTYWEGKFLERDKFDVDKFGSPTSYQMFPSILRMRCVKMCAPRMGCRRGGFSARCMQCECATQMRRGVN